MPDNIFSFPFCIIWEWKSEQKTFELFINWQDLWAFDGDTLNGVTFTITRTMTNFGVFIFSCNTSIISHFMLYTHSLSGMYIIVDSWRTFSFFLSSFIPFFFFWFFERWWIGNSSVCPLLRKQRLFCFIFSLLIVCYFVEYICIDFTECFGR